MVPLTSSVTISVTKVATISLPNVDSKSDFSSASKRASFKAFRRVASIILVAAGPSSYSSPSPSGFSMIVA